MRTYPSKILLFGEYILLIGGTALAVPMPAYSGRWVEALGKVPSEWHQKLLQFANSRQLEAVHGLATKAFIQDLHQGLIFESNIPIGYGLGSSGALCAAVYDRYCHQKTSDLNALKHLLAGMESFFHGASSGIDPLTSYVERALVIRHKTTVEFAEMAEWENPPVVFLIDSATPRKTADLVPWFVDKSSQAAFLATLNAAYLPAHELLVDSWIRADTDVFWPNLRFVSQFQVENFIPMIPATLRELWLENLERNDIIFKICGAGGGGYMLGFCRSLAPVEALSKQFKIVFPFSSHKP